VNKGSCLAGAWEQDNVAAAAFFFFRPEPAPLKSLLGATCLLKKTTFIPAKIVIFNKYAISVHIIMTKLLNIEGVFWLTI
jgi:hypothetical protein